MIPNRYKCIQQNFLHFGPNFREKFEKFLKNLKDGKIFIEIIKKIEKIWLKILIFALILTKNLETFSGVGRGWTPEGSEGGWTPRTLEG